MGNLLPELRIVTVYSAPHPRIAAPKITTIRSDQPVAVDELLSQSIGLSLRSPEFATSMTERLVERVCRASTYSRRNLSRRRRAANSERHTVHTPAPQKLRLGA